MRMHLEAYFHKHIQPLKKKRTDVGGLSYDVNIHKSQTFIPQSLIEPRQVGQSQNKLIIHPE
jgi:hypothetical protein